VFGGVSGQVEVPSAPAFSIPTTGQLTVSAWMRPDGWSLPAACLDPSLPPYVSSSPYFGHTEDSAGTEPSARYVHWLGKGEGSGPAGQQEWAFRMYSCDHVQTTNGQPEYRAGRISFYVFNASGGEGVGSYYQPGFPPLFSNDSLWHPNRWIHVVGIADGERTYVYVDGQFKKCDTYAVATSTVDPRGHGTCPAHTFQGQPLIITPQAGSAPLRMGHRDSNSYFDGALSRVRVWNRALTDQDIQTLHDSDFVPGNGLVAQYRLDEGCGNTVFDTAGAGAPNGTLSGGATWSMTTCSSPLGPSGCNEATCSSTPSPSGCPTPHGRVKGWRLGPVWLGLTRVKLRTQFAHFFTKGPHKTDVYCLAGGGIRAGFPSSPLLRSLPPRERKQVRGRAILALTANTYYALDGVRPGAKLKTAANRLRIGRGFKVGVNTWYLIPGPVADRVMKVRGGAIREIGIADKRFTTNRQATRRLLKSFG
jgi:hypothetical protein